MRQVDSEQPNADGLLIQIDGQGFPLEITPSATDGAWRVKVGGKVLNVDARLVQPGVLSILVDGRAYRCVLDEGPVETAIQIDGQRYVFTIDDPRSLAARRSKTAASGGLQIIKAPMPGRIVRLLASRGDPVETHQGLVVIEAMKMQNELKAARAGKVVEIRVQAGATVAAGSVLMTIE
jgi:biotin carboxyl carrier protein